jgi:DNA replication protein DnaC
MEWLDTPKRYRTTAAENALLDIDKRMLEFSARWCGDCGALLLGPTGCGKSLAAATAMNRLTLRKPRHWAAWVRSDALGRLMTNRDNAADVCRIKSVHLLVVDDLGYERFPEPALELIGERYDRDLPTVVTSGLTSAEFQLRYSAATARKIIEVGNGYGVDVWSSQSATELPQGTVPDSIRTLQSEKPWNGCERRSVSGAELGLPGF